MGSHAAVELARHIGYELATARIEHAVAALNNILGVRTATFGHTGDMHPWGDERLFSVTMSGGHTEDIGAGFRFGDEDGAQRTLAAVRGALALARWMGVQR